MRETAGALVDAALFVGQRNFDWEQPADTLLSDTFAYDSPAELEELYSQQPFFRASSRISPVLPSGCLRCTDLFLFNERVSGHLVRMGG